MSFRSSVTLAVMMSIAPFGLLAAQQTSAPVANPVPMAASAPEQAAPAVSPSAPVAARPHASPLFQKDNAAATSPAADMMAASSEGKNHTIVLSTLAIVLIAVLLAVLIF